jgi:Family of unknown function (DUF6186)
MTTRQATFLVWATLGALVLVVLLASTLSDDRFPTLGSVVRRATSSRVGQVVLLVGWMWLGWHAFAR